MTNLTRLRLQVKQSGFSLLEILVAFSILALSLGVLFQSFSLGLRNARTSEEYTLAALLAQSQLALVGYELELKPGEVSGEFEQYPRYRWTLTIQPYPLANANPEWVDKVRQQLLAVSLQVAWGDSYSPRTIQLDTLRLVDKALGEVK